MSFFPEDKLDLGRYPDIPIKGTQLVVRNIEGKAVRIKRGKKSGIYRWKSGEWSWVRDGYDVFDLQSEGELVIWFPRKGEVISAEGEIIRVESREVLIDRGGLVDERLIEIVKQWRMEVMGE